MNSGDLKDPDPGDYTEYENYNHSIYNKDDNTYDPYNAVAYFLNEEHDEEEEEDVEFENIQFDDSID